MKRNEKANCELFISFRRLQIHFGIIIISVITLAEINYLHDKIKRVTFSNEKERRWVDTLPTKNDSKREENITQAHVIW